MSFRRAFMRAAIVGAILLALSAAALYFVARSVPPNDLELLKAVIVQDPVVRPPICLLEGCVDAEHAERFCLMHKPHLRRLDAACSHRPLRIRLVELWPIRPGGPL